MANSHKKSSFTILLDFTRNILILIATGYCLYLLWNWHWLAAVIGAIPVYIVAMNIIGFITLPLYSLSPEKRILKNTYNAFDNEDFEKANELNVEFEEKFKN